jgi:hypothetical protein
MISSLAQSDPRPFLRTKRRTKRYTVKEKRDEQSVDRNRLEKGKMWSALQWAQNGRRNRLCSARRRENKKSARREDTGAEPRPSSLNYYLPAYLSTCLPNDLIQLLVSFETSFRDLISNNYSIETSFETSTVRFLSGPRPGLVWMKKNSVTLWSNFINFFFTLMSYFRTPKLPWWFLKAYGKKKLIFLVKKGINLREFLNNFVAFKKLIVSLIFFS